MSHASTQMLAYGADARRAARSLVWTAIWSGIAHAVSEFASNYANRRRANRAVAELSGLSDRMLKDIGVQRHDIERIARCGRDVTDIRASADSADTDAR